MVARSTTTLEEASSCDSVSSSPQKTGKTATHCSLPSVAFVTLGCAKNEVDSARMRACVQGAGYRVVEDPALADAIVVNTCSFIQAATEESIETIFDIANLPEVATGRRKLLVSGCMPARYGDDLAKELTEAAAFIPCDKEDDIVSVLDELFGKESLRANSAPAVSLSSQVSAYVKISDGCDRWCSYCTIPAIRGRYHSFTLEEVSAQIQTQIAAGAREIVLIAQDTGRWGSDFVPALRLSYLLEQVAKRHHDTWFRVMYIQPEGITDDLLDVVARYDNICPYFDIPLQHVNKTVLRAMNRRGSREEFNALLQRIRTRLPHATLRTTFIAGFPGETEDQFEELCNFIEKTPFDYIGVFPYSREENTRAYDLPHQIDDHEKQLRAQRLRDLADEVCVPRIAARIGQEMEVLIEGVEEDGQLFGRAMCQAPEVDGVTYLEQGTVGQRVRIKIIDTLLYEMEGV